MYEEEDFYEKIFVRKQRKRENENDDELEFNLKKILVDASYEELEFFDRLRCDQLNSREARNAEKIREDKVERFGVGTKTTRLDKKLGKHKIVLDWKEKQLSESQLRQRSEAGKVKSEKKKNKARNQKRGSDGKFC